MAGKLTLVATTGLLGAAVFLALGAGLAGRDLLQSGQLRGGLSPACTTGATAARRQLTLPIVPGNGLSIALPATVHYQPGGPAEAVISGDPALLAHVRLDGRTLRLDCQPGWFSSRLDVRVSGPAIADWALLGSGDLTLSRIDQPQLRLQLRGSGSITSTGSAEAVEVEVSGSGEALLQELNARSARVVIRGSGTVTASGVADDLDVRISGSGDALLKQLTAQSARINIRGSGDAEVTAQKEADVSISGSGDVALAGHPAVQRSKVSGSGSITQTS